MPDKLQPGIYDWEENGQVVSGVTDDGVNFRPVAPGDYVKYNPLNRAKERMIPSFLEATGEAVKAPFQLGKNILYDLPIGAYKAAIGQVDTSKIPTNAGEYVNAVIGGAVQNWTPEGLINEPGRALFDVASAIFPAGKLGAGKHLTGYTKALYDKVRHPVKNALRPAAQWWYSKDYVPAQRFIEGMDVLPVDDLQKYEMLQRRGVTPSLGTTLTNPRALAVEGIDPKKAKGYLEDVNLAANREYRDLYDQLQSPHLISLEDDPTQVASKVTDVVKQQHELDFSKLQADLKTLEDTKSGILGSMYRSMYHGANARYFDKQLNRWVNVTKQDFLSNPKLYQKYIQEKLGSVQTKLLFKELDNITADAGKLQSTFDERFKWKGTRDILSGEDYTKVVDQGLVPRGAEGAAHNPEINLGATFAKFLDNPEEVAKALHYLPGNTRPVMGEALFNAIYNGSKENGIIVPDLFAENLRKHSRNLVFTTPGENGSKIRTGLVTLAKALEDSGKLATSTLNSLRLSRDFEVSFRNLSTGLSGATTRPMLGAVQAGTLVLKEKVLGKILRDPDGVWLLTKLAKTPVTSPDNPATVRKLLRLMGELNIAAKFTVDGKEVPSLLEERR